jgi:rRNA maturation RNase YbeY
MKKLSAASIQLHQQKATTVQRQLPSLTKIKTWIKAALEHNNFASDSDITIRFVDEPESAELNFKYRKKHGATNILTFPCSAPDELKLRGKNAALSTRSTSVGAMIAPLILNANRFLGLVQIDPSSLELPRGGKERAKGVYKNVHDLSARRCQQSGKPKCEGYTPLPTLSGDLVICVPLVIKEARRQKLPFTAHLAHLIIHGVLHLLGYTHTQEKYATIMEKQETTILRKLGYVDPYL